LSILPAIWVRRLTFGAWIALIGVIMGRVVQDAGMIFHGLIKLELGNALQLEQHAAIRDGFFLLATGLDASYEAIHHWFFHVPLAISPRPELAAILLLLLDAFTAWLIFRMVRDRFGRLPAVVAASMHLAAPVAPILTKHVISTAFVPLFGWWMVIALFDFSRDGGRRPLGRLLASFGVLVALNHWHLLLLPVVLFAIVRRREWKASPWAWTVAVVPLLAVVARGMQDGVLDARLAAAGQIFDVWMADLPRFARRMILVEPDIHQMVPWLGGLLVLTGAAAFIAFVVHRRERPAGLLSWLAVGPLFVFAGDIEATVVWASGLLLLFAWVSHLRPLFGVTLSAFALVAVGLQAHLYLTFGPPGVLPEPAFFPLHTVAQRDEILDVLDAEFEIGQAEFDRLYLEHPVGETHGGLVPGMLPGLRYLQSCCRPFPPGGDRCVAVTSQPLALPEGAVLDRQLKKGWLTYTAWRGGGPCPPSAWRTPPRAVWLDLQDWRIRDRPIR
jgi:hypothetical protein